MEVMSPLVLEALELRSESARKRKRRALLRAAIAQVFVFVVFRLLYTFFI
jgi:hypothetical protein